MEGSPGELLAEVVAVAGVDGDVFFFGDDQVDFVVADGVTFVGGVGEAVLVAEVFVNFGVDGVDGFFFGDFEEAAAGFSGDLLEDFFAVGAVLLRIPTPAAAAAHPASSAHAETAGAAAIVFVLVGEQDGIDDGVGTLRSGNGFGQGFLAAVVDAVRKYDERFAALLLAHQFIRREENRIVEERSAAV